MGFKVSRRLSLDRSFAAYKVHDHRDDGKDKEQMDKKTAHVEEEKSAKPKHYQNDTQNEKHCGASFFLKRVVARARPLQVVREGMPRIRCSTTELMKQTLG